MPKHRTRLLVLDDEKELLDDLALCLREEGYDVFCGVDGREGEKLFRQHAPDLVIIDIVMPNREGMETIISLRKQNPNLPIIAISGNRWRKEFLRASSLLGADSVLEKPFELDRLKYQIRYLLDQHKHKAA